MVIKLQFGVNQLSLLTIVSIFLSLCCTTARAQDDYRYFGFGANFGTKSTRITSDLPAIDGMNVVVEGGSLALVIGNEVLKGRFHAAGFYYSSPRVQHTVNIFASSVVLNIYPVKFINKSRQALNPYVIGAVDYDNLKFRGYYTIKDAKVNHSRSSAPYIGKIGAACGSAGAGLEWRLPRMNDFVHVFAEARYSWIVNTDADEVLENTRAENVTSVNLGVSFGFLR